MKAAQASGVRMRPGTSMAFGILLLSGCLAGPLSPEGFHVTELALEDDGSAVIEMPESAAFELSWEFVGTVLPASGSPIVLLHAASNGSVTPLFAGFFGGPLSAQDPGVVEVGAGGNGVGAPAVIAERPVPYMAQGDLAARGGVLWVFWAELPAPAQLTIRLTDPPVSTSTDPLRFAGEPEDTVIEVGGVQVRRGAIRAPCTGTSMIYLDLYADEAPLEGKLRFEQIEVHEIVLRTRASTAYFHRVFTSLGPSDAKLDVEISGGGPSTSIQAFVACAPELRPLTAWSDLEMPL